MSQVDNGQLNNIVRDAVNATANAHQKYIAALEQRLKDKDAEIERLRELVRLNPHDFANTRKKEIQVEAVKEFAEQVYTLMTLEENWRYFKDAWLEDGECLWLKSKIYNLVKRNGG